MSKKSKTILLVVGVIIILAAISAGLWMHFNNASFEEDIKNSIDSAWGESDTDDTPAFLQEITRLSSYEVTSIEEGDTYTINVVVKGIDLGSELKELSYEDFPQADDEDALNDYLLSIIENCEIIKTSTVIYAEPSAEGYEISFSDTFVDAMSGKIYSYYMDLIEGVLEG